MSWEVLLSKVAGTFICAAFGFGVIALGIDFVVRSVNAIWK